MSITVPDNRRSRDPCPKDLKASYGREARFEERPTRERNQGKGIQNLHRRGDGGCCGEITCELRKPHNTRRQAENENVKA